MYLSCRPWYNSFGDVLVLPVHSTWWISSTTGIYKQNKYWTVHTKNQKIELPYAKLLSAEFDSISKLFVCTYMSRSSKWVLIYWSRALNPTMKMIGMRIKKFMKISFSTKEWRYLGDMKRVHESHTHLCDKTNINNVIQ